MGHSRYDSGTYASYSSATRSRTIDDYKATVIPKGMDPKEIRTRESRKSDLNPHPTPVVIALDVTGSMSRVVEACRKQLGTIFEQIIDRKPVTDPHVMAMAVDDMDYDKRALQATQFEADPVTIGKQIEQLCIVGNGGGNGHESYLGPLYMLAMKASCDAFTETPQRKGFLFTIGDEGPQTVLTKKHVKDFFDEDVPNDLPIADLVKMIEANWHYYHIHVYDSGGYRHDRMDEYLTAWRQNIGERVVKLTDHHKLGEVVVSIIEVTAGRDKDAVAASWGHGTDLVVSTALSGLPTRPGTASTGPVTL